jgi:hypothetical protein
MTCWATVATMMHSWKFNRSDMIETALRDIGEMYLRMFQRDAGLSANDKPAFLRAAGLRVEAPQNYTVDGWAGLVRRFGPLWVTTNEGSGQMFAIHARIVTAVFGHGTPSGTSMIIVDPADGAVHTEIVADFVKTFEDVARIDLGASGDLRPQVVHY